MAHPKDGVYGTMNKALDAYGLGHLAKGRPTLTASGTTDNGADVWLPIVDGTEPAHSNRVKGDYIIERPGQKTPDFGSIHTTIARKEHTAKGWQYENLGKYQVLYADPARRVVVHGKVGSAATKEGAAKAAEEEVEKK
jgi:hypothetical protein